MLLTAFEFSNPYGGLIRKTKKPGINRALKTPTKDDQAPILRTPAERRDTLRDAVFSFITPLETESMISGCAAFSAALAASLSPLAIAYSTLRIYVRMRDRRALFTSVRRAILRTAFLADGVFAIGLPVICYTWQCIFTLLSQASLCEMTGKETGETITA